MNLKKKEFKALLLSLGKVNDSCVLDIREDGIHGLTSSDDNSLYIHAFLRGDWEEISLNLPSLKKLAKAIDMVDEDVVKLKFKINHLEYRDSKLKFKYHLYEEGIITKPKLSLEKIRNFEFDIDFPLDLAFISNLLQKTSITGTTKLYISTEDGKLLWKIGDETVPNSDTLSIIGDEVDFELEDPFIIKIDSLKLLSKVSKENNLFKINSKLRVGMIRSEIGDFELEYLFSSLKN